MSRRLGALVSALPLLVAGLVLAGSPVVAVAQTSVTVTANCGNPSHGSVTFTGGTSSETAFVYLGTDASQNSPASLEIGPVALDGSTVTSALIPDGGYNYLITVSGVTEKAGSFTIGPCTTIVWGATATTAPATVHDTTASSTGGTVSYTFYSNGTCTGTGTPAGSGTSSNTEGPLGVGSYSFTATFAPTEAAAVGIGAVSACEPFTVTPPPGPTATSITTVVFNAATNAALIGGNLVAGGSVYDTSTVPAGATGTVSYKFWANGDCGVSEEVGGTDAGTALALGSHSSAVGPLTAGSYSFEAVYTSDNTALFTNATGSCEPFSVTAAPTGPTNTSITTVVFNAETKTALVGNLVAGGSVYDTSSVTNGATGTVSYLFWTNGDCGVNEDVAGTDAGSGLALGSHSSTEGPLSAGSYSFDTAFTSDNTALFTNATGGCEPFSLTVPPPVAASTTTSTAVFDAATNAALIDGNLTASGSAYDTSTVTAGATGTVSYTFYSNGTCNGTGTAAGTGLALGTKSSTEGPLTAGSYSFEAVYTSDYTALFTGSTSACEPFTVVEGGVGGSTASPSPTAAPTGAVLAATGGGTPAQGLALFLIAFGLLAMVGGALARRLARRRRRV
jgi:hypothetical protein